MDTSQWPQVNIGGVSPVENPRPAEKKPRPEKEQALNCPRCNSTNTKFCYYNNYSLSQPRYFCKTCRRYWTEGGTLRNVPVGGGSRKNKRPSSSSTSSSSSSSSVLSASRKVVPNLSTPKTSSPNPNNKIHEGEDLSLGFSHQSMIYNRGSEFVATPFGLDIRNQLNQENPNFTPNSSHLQMMEVGSMSSGGMISSLISMPVATSNSVYLSSGFPMHEFKPSLSFSMDGLHDQNGYVGNLQMVQDHTMGTSTRTLISPIEGLKAGSSTGDQFDLQDTTRQGNSTSNNGYWNGMLAGSGSWYEGT